MKALLDMLIEVRNRAKNDFAGVGVICYAKSSDFEKISPGPVQMTDAQECQPTLENPIELLITISQTSNALHDGFHFFNTGNAQLTHLGMYFAPPPNGNVKYPSNRKPGTRYFAALYASIIPGVQYSGIIRSSDLSISTFRNGQEVHHF